MIGRNAQWHRMCSLLNCPCLDLPFFSQRLYGFSIPHLISLLFVSKPSEVSWNRHLAPCLIQTQDQGSSKVLKSWGSSRGTDKLFYLEPKSTPLPLLVAVYLLPTMARGGQLRSRTTLSCFHFSIHAGMSAHSYSMSVSLRLAKPSGSTSIRQLPFHFCVGDFFFPFLFFFLQTHMRDF